MCSGVTMWNTGWVHIPWYGIDDLPIKEVDSHFINNHCAVMKSIIIFLFCSYCIRYWILLIHHKFKWFKSLTHILWITQAYLILWWIYCTVSHTVDSRLSCGDQLHFVRIKVKWLCQYSWQRKEYTCMPI